MKPTVVGLDQPSSLPRTSAKTKRKRLAEKEMKPIQSMLRVRMSFDLAMRVSVTKMATTPIGHIDEEDPAPADGAGDGAADQRTDGHGTPDDAAVDTEGRAAVLALERLCDQGEGGGEHDGATHTLHGPRQIEHERVGRQAADQRRQGEEGQSAGEDLAATVNVADDPGGEEEGGQRQGVGIDHPLQVGEGGVQRTLDVRQGHVHDRDVEQQHEDGGTDRDQGPPLAFEAGHLRSVSRACDGPYNVV